MPLQHRYEHLAAALEYPTEQTAALLETCEAQFRASCPRAAELLTPLRQYLTDNPLETVQERYTRTFDLTPVCALDVGYHLFGEDWQRGPFLARLRESQQEAGVNAGLELPDHLPIVLKWLARVEGTDVHDDMVRECVLPALAKMDACLADSDNPYRHLLRAIAAVLKQGSR